MGVNRVYGEVTGLFARNQGMDAAIDDDDRVARRFRKIEASSADEAIYVIATVGAPFVKIGWVRHRAKAQDRCELIQVGCPYPLQVVITVGVDGRRAETKLHKAFELYHFRGEWFRCEGRLKAFVQVAAAYPELTLDEMLEKSS